MSFRSLAERSHRRSPHLLVLLTFAAAATLSGLASGQNPPAPGSGTPSGAKPAPGAAAPRGRPDPIVARVEGETIRLSEIEARRDRITDSYARTAGRDVPPGYEQFFLRAATEEAIRERLIRRDGAANGLRVPDASAESLMKSDAYFQTDGRFDPARFEAYRTQNPKSFAEARAQARDHLLYIGSARRLERRFAPDAATIEALWIARGSRARVRYALVSEAHYDGEVDPTDEELRAYYRQRLDAFARPAEVTLTTLGFSAAGGAGGDLEDARSRAADLLRAAEGGMPFDSLAARPGVVRGNASWRDGQPRGMFEADTALARVALSSSPGRILPRIVATAEGVGIARVERLTPRVDPPLHQIAVDVRARWRNEQIQMRRSAEARRFYDAHPDSFRIRAWSVRWATVDSTRVRPKAPSEKELRAWFEARKTEFARLDPSGAGIQLVTFEEARPRAEERWRTEHLGLEARRLADDLAVAWSKGKNPKPEANAVSLGGPAWLIEGGVPPEGLTPALADSARLLTASRRALVMTAPGGFAIVGLVRLTEAERVPFETVAPGIESRLERERLEAERRQARAWFEERRDRYRTGPGYAIGYATSAPPPTALIDIPGATIERYYREHASEYGTPTEVRVRHILIGTRDRTDAQAQGLARTLLTRTRNGEDFATLALEVSDDPGSRAEGGDLGFLRPGATVPAFDRAAFGLSRERPLAGPIKTEFGYHVLQLVERREGTVPSFDDVRADIGSKLAIEYADTLARQAAEGLRRSARSYDELLTLASERKMTTALVRWYDGLPLVGPSTIDEVRGDAPGVPPRGVFPRAYRYLTQGYVTIALDSIMPPRPLEFDEIADRVLADRKRDRRLEAARARADQIVADLGAGRPWAEALETAGSTMESRLFGRAEGLGSVGAVSGLDSLLFGPGVDTLAVGGWARLPTPRGELFVQLLERQPPDPVTAARDRQNARDLMVNRRLYEYVEELREKYTVEVLRPDLAERIPEPPAI